jgi:drug/metabolite transporter (DMT)-like permease
MQLGLLFAVGAAIVWGCYIFFLKHSFSGYPPAGLTVLINAAAIAWFLPVTVATTDLDGTKLTGADPVSDPIGALGGVAGSLAAVDPAAVAVVAVTATTTAAAFVLFLRAIEDGDVSYVTPINKVVPMFVLPLEVLLLGEVLAPIQVAGVVVATAAVGAIPGAFVLALVAAFYLVVLALTLRRAPRQAKGELQSAADAEEWK